MLDQQQCDDLNRLLAERLKPLIDRHIRITVGRFTINRGPKQEWNLFVDAVFGMEFRWTWHQSSLDAKLELAESLPAIEAEVDAAEAKLRARLAATVAMLTAATGSLSNP